MKVYGFMYNGCIHESSWATVSLHLSEEGAKKALEEHKAKEKEKYDHLSKFDDADFPMSEFGIHEDWCIHEFEILP